MRFMSTTRVGGKVNLGHALLFAKIIRKRGSKSTQYIAKN
jgi:hypothetical protein